MFARIIIKQLRHKWVNNLLLFVTMVALVSLYVFVMNTNSFTVRSMQLIMKNMGLNQLVIPQSAPASTIYLCTDDQPEFPDRVTPELASHLELLSKYYLSVLQQKMDFAGHELILTGIRPVQRPDETAEKGHPIMPVEAGSARLGFAAAHALHARAGESIPVGDEQLVVSAVAAEQGTLDDYRVFVDLSVAQRLLRKPGVINVIYSFECLHVGGSLDSIHQFQQEALARVLPGFRQINIASVSQGRYDARGMTEKYQYYLLGIVALLTVLMVAISGLQEIAERKYETGILVAQGTGYSYIAGLYLCKTLVLAALATGCGFVLGGAASVVLTHPFLATQTREVSIAWGNLPSTLGLICAVALVAEFIPMIQLVRMDPCTILMEE